MPRSIIHWTDVFPKSDRHVETSTESQIEQAITHMKRVKKTVKLTVNNNYPATAIRGPNYYCRAEPADFADATQAIVGFSNAG